MNKENEKQTLEQTTNPQGADPDEQVMNGDYGMLQTEEEDSLENSQG